MTSRILPLLVGTLLLVGLEAFAVPPTGGANVRGQVSLLNSGGKESEGGFGGFFSDFISSLDDQIDDFFNKRMGNGEVFYGYV